MGESSNVNQSMERGIWVRAMRRVMGFMLLVTLIGCGRIEALAMMEERPTDVDDAPGCTSDEDAARGWQYRSQMDMGEVPPSRAKRGKKSYIGRSQVTKAVESSSSLQTALLVVEIIVLIVAVFLLMVAFGSLTAKETSKQRKITLFAAAFVGLVVATVLGYGAGSVVSLDNPSKHDVAITINGDTVQVPSGKFTDVRVMSSTLNITTEAKGKTVEELTMLLDDGIFETLFRATLGDGRYIYSVCGTTKYHLRSAKYE